MTAAAFQQDAGITTDQEPGAARGLALLAHIATPDASGEHRSVVAVVPGPPASKARPRFARSGRAYHDPKSAAAEEYTGWHIRKALGPLGAFPGNVAVVCIFYRADRYRADVDNMLKHVCDAANRVAWADDSQVTAILGVAEYDPDNPRTVVVLGHHASTLTRGVDDVIPCPGCGGGIQRSAKRKFCSDECRQRVPYGALAEPIPCPTCGVEFRRKTSTQQTCSIKCRADGKRGQARPRASNRSSCEECGKGLAHNRGGRCRDCWRSSIAGRPVAAAPHPDAEVIASPQPG